MRFLSTKVQSKPVVGYFDVVHRVLDLPRHELDNLYTKYERNFLATVRRIYFLQLNKSIIYFRHQYLMFRLRYIIPNGMNQTNYTNISFKNVETQ